MQISRINTYQFIQEKNNNNSDNKNKSFKGAVPISAPDRACLWIANLIENGGLAVSFTLQDMLGTNFPRPFMGYNRNKEENNGEANISFALKEATREFLTGPSMFLIPMGMLGASKKLYGSACEIPAKFIKAFGDIHSNISNKSGKAISQEEFYKNTFCEILKNAKEEKKASSDTIQQAEIFAKRLSKGIKNSNLNKTIEELNQDFVNLSKSHASDAVHADFTLAKTAEGIVSPFKKTVSHMVSYADDVVKTAGSKNKFNVKYIKNTVNKKITGRFALNLAMYTSVMGFLQIIPKLYNKAEGDKNSGLKGLVKEETAKTQNKSNPSFGSYASIAKKITGNGKFGTFASKMEYDGCNVGFDPLVGIMAGGIMYPRVVNAKDKYDLEEILRRDLVTCVVMCVAEKELRKGFSKFNEIKSGLVLASKEKGFDSKSLFKKVLDYLKPINGVNVLSSEQIRAKYTNIDKYKNGVKGFCDFISGQGGSLSKLFSLTEESREIVDTILKKEGKSIDSADNKTITEAIDKAKNSEEVKKLAGLFHETKITPKKNPSWFDKLIKQTNIVEDNPWVKKARTLNSRFTALSVVILVPVFLGFMLPAINERATKARINKEQEQEKANRPHKFFLSTKVNSPIFEDIAVRRAG